MSGHSKWSSIKHKKAATDAKRGKQFSRLSREVMVAAKTGGGDPGQNPRLRKAMEACKAVNMPNDNVTRAIKKGTGEIEGVVIEEITFEGYGPGGVAILVKTTTDNRNRTVGEIRHMFSKHGGNLGDAGCVAWMFNKTGYLVVPKQAAGAEEALLEIVLGAGAEDLREDGSNWEILCPPESVSAVQDALVGQGITPTVAEVSMLPQNTVRLEGAQVRQCLKLMDAIEDHDDVQSMHANFDIDETEIENALAATSGGGG